ncbi:MAG: LLM class flavin-dependent oxidoreductase [Deltaproteobacteria bacterium]|nr:LLM class flavin-dependent oxidoreductase [Deltaproteobacteria bacterium]
MASNGFESLGVGTDGVTSMSETLELAKAADALGYHSFWLSEGYHSRSAIVRATLIAAATSKIKIALGILSPHTKHPALLAMDAASLDEVARGRVILGIGRVLNALRKHALDSAGTTQLVKESIEIIKGILSGQRVQYDGRIFKIPPPGSRLDLDPCGELPIYVGATGPAMLRLAGQYADGVLFNYPCTPGFVEYAMPFITEGLTRSSRSLEKFGVAAYLLISVDENEKKALDAAKRFVAQKLATRHSEMLRHAGVTAAEIAAVREKVETLGVAKAAAELDDDLVRKVTIAGTPDQVVQGVQAFIGTGLTLPIVWEIVGPDRRRALGLIAKEVMAKLL